MINLSNWLDSRGTFKDVTCGEVELQIVSLSKGLIEQLKVLPTYEMMADFVAEHGLAHNRTRITDDENMCEDLPVIWAMPEFEAAKEDIVTAIVGLSEVAEILNDKQEAEELAAIEAEENKNTIDGDNLGDQNVTLGQLHEDNQLNP